MARSRRNDSGYVDEFFKLFLSVPWWVGPVVAAITFAALRWVIPWVFAIAGGGDDLRGSMLSTLSMFSVKVAPFAGAFVLLIWIGAEIKKRLDGQRVERQSGSGSINALDWREFESLLSEAFRRQGFTVEHAGGARPDGGVDLRMTKAGAVTLVQCKHWKSWKVGVAVVRELLGVMSSERAQSGIVVTSGVFTPDAITFASRNPIRLINGRELVVMIGEVQKSGRIAGTGAASAATRTQTAAPSVSEIKCPLCGAAMVRRVARKGPKAGGAFLGCSRYPDCRGTQDLS